MALDRIDEQFGRMNLMSGFEIESLSATTVLSPRPALSLNC